jgi:hypothetical protein
MWYGPRCDVIYMMYATILFFLIFHNFYVDESTTGRSHMVVLYNFYGLCVNFKCHVIALFYLQVVCNNVVATCNMWGDNRGGMIGVHVGALEIEIKGIRMAIPCHIFYIHVMFILYVSYFSLIAVVTL